MKKVFTSIISLIVCLMISFTFTGCHLFRNEVFVPNLPNSEILASEYKLEVNQDPSPEYNRVNAVKKVERSVVAIELTYPVNLADGTQSQSTAYGSGVIVDNGNTEDNLFFILTCHHVIDAKGSIKVYVPDENCRNYTDADYNTKFTFTGVIENSINNGEVRLIGGDKLSDVAVLLLDVTGTGVSKDKIASSVLPHADYTMQRGESVFSVGNPSGKLPMTVSDGIISYLDRETFIKDIGITNLMQIDVQINHGNSGGGLFNYYGELIGITNAGSEEYEGLNYSIPYKLTYGDGGFVSVAEQLIATHYETFNGQNYGYVSGSWELGIMVEQVASNLSSTYVKVKQVLENSNCEGVLLANDIILGVSCTSGKGYSKEVTALSEFSLAMDYLRSYASLGDTITLKIQRGTQTAHRCVQLTKQLIFCNTGINIPENN